MDKQISYMTSIGDALECASRAPQFMSCNYYVCVWGGGGVHCVYLNNINVCVHYTDDYMLCTYIYI